MVMTQSNAKKRISITVDAQLIQQIDCLTKNRSAAIEEALRLWHRQQIEEQLRQSYQNLPQSEIYFERDWAQFAQEQMEQILDEEGN
jgi:Arc/MetJ-type ribon-helix-helix transcriptional regulator